jgi:hypothetical protein
VKCHWISTEYFTVMVKTDNAAKVVWAAPLVRRFLGQPVGNLLNWAIPFGGLRLQAWESAQKPQTRPQRS